MTWKWGFLYLARSLLVNIIFTLANSTMQFIQTHGMRRAIAALGLGLLTAHANASLISMDFAPNSGDNWITRDSATRLDWLDVTLTTSQSYDQVRTGVWYQQGFRYATQAEVSTLFLNAGTPDDNFDVSVTFPSETLALAQLLGPTLVSGNRVTTTGFTGTDFSGNDITTSNHPIGSYFTVLLGKVDYIAPYGEAHFSGGHPLSSAASATYGSFLVRDVPEPGTTSMVLIAGLALVASRMRHKKNWRR